MSELPEGYTLEKAESSASATNVADGTVAATADTLVIRNAQGKDVTDELKIRKDRWRNPGHPGAFEHRNWLGHEDL